MRLTIDTLGEEIVARDLIRMGDRATDVSDVMGGEVTDLLRGSMTRQFDSQGQYGSGGWPALASSTVAAKQAAGLDPRILHATRRLRDSLTEGGHGDQVVVARRDGLDFGTSVEYAGYHQHGQGVPQRRPVQLPEADRREVVRILQRALVSDGRSGLLGRLWGSLR